MDDDQLLLQLWGKTVQGDNESYHPALFHMLDAGFVAKVLLGSQATPRWRRTISRALGTTEQHADDCVPLIVALHDIGKLSLAFQALVPEQARRLREAGLPMPRRHPSTPHPLVSAAAVRGLHGLTQMPARLGLAVTETVGGHHGRWLKPGQAMSAAKALRLGEPPAFSVFRDRGYSVLASALSRRLDWPTQADVSAAIMALTGFTILCDWLASDEHNFPATAPMDLGEYIGLSEARAREAVESAGLLQDEASDAPTGFAELFPTMPPRPLQHAIDLIPDALLAQPSLTVIEAPTGEGKTEAALALAHRIGALRGSDALYYALPTMATSNQMFTRVEDYLHGNLHLSTGSRLIHGQAHLVEDDLRPQPMVNGPNDRPASPEWFAPRKRSLLAAFGVGTIDQAELTVLNVRHEALRCVGLSGKTVLLDEVHAYDAYMSTIIERLMTWLRTMGASVILLSATLPLSRIRQMTEAWGGDSHTVESRSDAYPQIWTLSDGTAHALSPPAFKPSGSLDLHWLRFDRYQVADKAQWLLDRIAGGGCACWICNTVSQAQALHTAVRQQASADLPVDLAHSRFPLAQREQIEGRIVKRYGPKSPDRRHGIVIGTQVLEQSLDLDFDLMVTDLAPVDLILQRAGRSHRHHRPARPIKQATLFINCPHDSEGGPELGVSAAIYDEYILLRTLGALEGMDRIDLPSGYRALVEAVYQDAAPSDESLQPSWEAFQTRMANARGCAQNRLVPSPHPNDPFCQPIANLLFQDDDSKTGWGVAQTRLGAESVTVVPMEREGYRCTLPLTGETFSLDQVPGRELALHLLRHNLRVSHKALMRRLRRVDVERGNLFGHPMLANVQPLWLRNGEAQMEGTGLRVALEPELGLIIDYVGKGGAE